MITQDDIDALSDDKFSQAEIEAMKTADKLVDRYLSGQRTLRLYSAAQEPVMLLAYATMRSIAEDSAKALQDVYDRQLESISLGAPRKD